MAAQKRALDDSSSAPKSKKPKTDVVAAPTITSTEEVDFPRGGGTSFTPLEVKSIRAEAQKEANDELFKGDTQTSKKRKRNSEKHGAAADASGEKSDRVRIEHLNYKRMHVGMKILGQIVSVQPLALIVSLPNQLFGHVPITNISSQLTDLLEKAADEEESPSDDEDDQEESEESNSGIPDLTDLFQPGDYVRTTVSSVHPPGATDMSGMSKSRDEFARASRRVELTLVPERVNVGVQKSDLKTGFTLSSAVKSVEDHGYLLDIGVSDISGFLSFKEAKSARKFRVGQLLNVTVKKLSGNGRTCDVTIDPETFTSSSISEVSNVTSVLPGTLVQCLVTAVHPTGLNVQVLGFFEGTIEELHLSTLAKPPKLGKKVKARVLYDIAGTPPRFVLALADHIIRLGVRHVSDETTPTLPQAYPIGKVLDEVKVIRIEPERGLVAEIKPTVHGFVHISHVSDDHLPSLSNSGPWKAGALHRARITGYFLLDGILQLSLKPSLLNQKFFRIDDLHVGEVIKGTVKKLTNSGLFVTISGNIDGVVWPNHYADIVLKHPAKRFKVGASIKCRVLVVDPERKRVSLTAKKSLMDSTLPALSSFDDAKVGLLTHAVVFKVLEKHLMVEFYNNVKAIVPMKEISDTLPSNLPESYPVGKVVKVRVISIEPDQRRLVASIRQAAPNFKVFNTDLDSVEVGNIVEGVVYEIHKENAVLSILPMDVRALVSLNNLANHRALTVAQLRMTLKVGEKLEELVVVTRNVEKGFVIVANKPKQKPAVESGKNALSLDTVETGKIVSGRVTRHVRQGALVKLTAHVRGILHPTDASDDYEAGVPFPSPDSILRAAVVDVDKDKKQVTLSTRHSRMYPNQHKDVVDREITDLSDVKVGDSVRGFITSVAEHGIFITIGRNVDARVQIRELFDDYVKEWKGRFQANQLVRGRILSINVEERKIEMTFRSGELNKAPSSLSLGDLQKGQKVEGTVKKVEEYGLFIQINGSKFSGLCHKSELSDNADADVDIALQGFHVDDSVKAVILNIDKRRISLSMRPSQFDDEDFTMDDEDSDVTSGVQQETVEDERDEELQDRESAPETEAEDEEEQPIDIPTELFHASKSSAKSSESAGLSALKLSGGFQWTADALEEGAGSDSDDSSSDDDDNGQSNGKKKRRRKEIEQDLTADMHTKTPESNSDFERLLLGSPNSSYLWIQYMSFQLQLSEIEKGREIARRALKTIHFREEQEKLNIWIALLNLECSYGTDESLEAVFKEAARANDSKTVHLRLALILDQTDKVQKAEDQYKRTSKKFGQSSKVWVKFSEHYLRRHNIEESRKLLPRALQSLEKRKHLKTISAFAQLEYKLGEPERGKTLLEGIVDSHPKRWDIWSIYMDMEARQGDIQSLRNLFDRVLAVKMTSHKAKSFFKKWLELERRIGDEEGAEAVKRKAVEWTQQISAS